MLAYYLRLAFKSVLSTPGLTALAVFGIGVGIAVPTTLLSIHHVFARNPIPHKSDVLYNVRVESWGTDSDFFGKAGEPPKHVTYRDMTGLRFSELPAGSTGIAGAVAFVFPEEEGRQPYRGSIRLCHAPFFAMFDAPFKYGTGWDQAADEERRRVVVLSKESNDRLFGGADSVGRTVRLGGGELTVVGVLDSFRPTPQYYDVINNAFGKPRDFFLPFDLIREQDMALNRIGDTDNWGPAAEGPDAFFTASETTWIQYWVELEPSKLAAYRDFVDAYAMEQKAIGRFPRPLNNRVTPLMEWLEFREVVPQGSKALVLIGMLFLVVCSLNLMGLLLGKFLARSGVLGVHRALGATKSSIFIQRLVECELVGLLGGLCGVGFTAVALLVVDRAMPSFIMAPNLFQVNGYSLAVAVSLALVAGLLSGIYPAWRACRIAPAIQLKVQ